MAKKETKQESPATVAAKTAAKVATRVFTLNPDITEVHVTSDGTAFYGRNDAQSHAKTLKNRDVFSYKRGDSTPEAMTVKAAKTKMTTTPATTPNTSTADKAGDEDDVDELGGQSINDEPTNTEE